MLQSVKMKWLKNTGLIFVISLLILATGGFSVFHHVCNCAGEVSTSLFTEVTCQDKHTEASCCSHTETPSCCIQKEKNKKAHTCHDKDCCQNSVQFFKISDSFQVVFSNIDLKPVLVTTPLVILDVTETNLQYLNLFPQSYNLPPPKTSRQILVSLHQLKLDTNLV